MLFMVIERFRNGEWARVGERFKQRGRMMPEGAAYVASWMGADGACCYQLMEAQSREAMRPWTDAWGDLVAFEIVEVVESKEFWKGK